MLKEMTPRKASQLPLVPIVPSRSTGGKQGEQRDGR
jgi:hypothetical protein